MMLKSVKLGENMKTIEIKTGKQIAQFTTKSVTFDGKEFFYSKMQNVQHNPAGCIYSFTYDGELKSLPYEPKDAKVLSAIFSQVQKLQPHKPAADSTPTVKAPAVPKEKPAKAPETPDIKEVMEHTDNKPAAEKISEEDPTVKEVEETASEPVVFEDKKAAKQAEKERKLAEKAKKKAEKEQKKAEKAALKANKNGDDTSGTEGTPDGEPDPEKKAKMKKSIITFAAIIGITAILAVAFYFIFGTSTNPSIGPNSTESQQYDDIDELINDLQ